MYTLAHLEILYYFQSQTKKFHLQSALKQKKIMDLISAGLLEHGEDDYTFLTSKGISILNTTEAYFNEEIKARSS